MCIRDRLTLIEIDICQKVLYHNGVVRACLDTQITPDTCHRATFLGNTALILVHARHENALTFGPFFPQLDNGFRAGLDTCACLLYTSRCV